MQQVPPVQPLYFEVPDEIEPKMKQDDPTYGPIDQNYELLAYDFSIEMM
jgi:hypothetical protein